MIPHPTLLGLYIDARRQDDLGRRPPHAVSRGGRSRRFIQFFTGLRIVNVHHQVPLRAS